MVQMWSTKEALYCMQKSNRTYIGKIGMMDFTNMLRFLFEQDTRLRNALYRLQLLNR